MEKELNFQIPKRMKYRNVKVEIDGIKFASKREAKYYGKLKILKQSGEVIDFQLQPRYDFIINGVNCGFYKGDFKILWKSGKIQVVDAKGMKLPVYNLKKKLMLACHRIVIHEV